MKVGIMAESIQEKMSGQAWFVYHLAKNLSRIKGLEVVLIGNEYLKNVDIEAKKLIFRRRQTLIQKILSVDVLRKINSENLDVIHSPVNFGLPYFYFVDAKRVKTIHDATGFEIDIGYPIMHKIQLKSQFIIFGNRIDKVIAVSNTSKEEAIKHLNVDKRKICVIYNGVDEIFRPMDKESCRKILEKYGIKGRYIFHLSNGSAVKNLPGIIKAFNKIRTKINCKLVIGGNINRRVESKDVLYIGYIPYKHLPFFYSGASIFVFPSFHEGFGLPVIEAMACGTPVITSNVYATREISGDAALLVNPHDIDEISKSMEKLLTDENLRESLIKRGLERAKRFSWKECARGYAEIYREVCSNDVKISGKNL